MPGHVNEVLLEAMQIQSSGIISIEEVINGVDVVLSQVQVQPGQQVSQLIPVVPSTTSVKIKFKYLGVSWKWYGKKICVKVPQMQSETYLVDVCDEVGDKYRFGFNGQEKVNEMAGIGNHNTAEFWEYDTRVARRWNTDPVLKEYESPYATFGNSPIFLMDPNGADTFVNGRLDGESEIMKRSGDPKDVHKVSGVKLQSVLNFSLEIKDEKIASLEYDLEAIEFESPVLGGIKPAFTRIINKHYTMSLDKKYATISYDVITQLSDFEVLGQWAMGIKNGIWQDNVITITQAVKIEIGIDGIKTSVDGSSFPEHTFNYSYIVNKYDKNNMLEGIKVDVKKKTLTQSSYKDAVDEDKFQEKSHKDRTTLFTGY